MIPFVFRDATVADADALVQIIHSAYRGDASREGWTTEAELLDGQRTDAREILSLLSAPGAHIRIATSPCDAAIIGTVTVRCLGAAGMIGMLAVSPTLQARGLGSRLLADAEATALSVPGIARARLMVIEQREELIAWYERRGYIRTGEHEAFPYGDPRFGAPRRDDLRFVVLEKGLSDGAHADRTSAIQSSS